MHNIKKSNIIVVIFTPGMVAFRLKGDNALTERLLKRLNARGYIHAVPACFKGIYVIRFTVTSQRTTNQDILGKSSISLLVNNVGWDFEGNIKLCFNIS